MGGGFCVVVLRTADKCWRMGVNGENHSSRTQAMSEDQLKAFLEAVKTDAGLQEKLAAATDADAAVEIAKEAGFMVSADELQRAQAEALEDAELEGVAGGKANRFGWCVTTILDGRGN